MVQFLIKRLIGLVFVILAVTFITFILGYLASVTGGDPIAIQLGNKFDPALHDRLFHQYGLDLPWYQQYLNFLGRLLHFDFGLSFKDPGYSVWDNLKDGVPVSAELGLWALVIQILIGIPLGIISALKANSWLDTLNMGAMLILFALPSFVLAVFFQAAIVWLDNNIGLGWPVADWGNPWQYSWADIQFKIGPILLVALGGLAFFARFARNTMLEVLRQDYVRTARAKGVRERWVIYRHALRNALIPLITLFGLSLGLIITGQFFIERTFNIQGIASVSVSSIQQLDYPVMQATTILLAIAVVLGNLLSDMLYTVADPRIKAQ